MTNIKHKYIAQNYTVAAWEKIPCTPGSESIPESGVNLLKNWNDDNRFMRDNRVEKYSQDILNNNFLYQNGIPIIIGQDGKIYNGQTRIAASIKAETDLYATIIYGVPKQAMLYQDHVDAVRPMHINSILASGKKLTKPLASKTKDEQSTAKIWMKKIDPVLWKQPTMVELELFIKSKQTVLDWVLKPLDNKNARKKGYRAAISQYREKFAQEAEIFHQGVGAADGVSIQDQNILAMRKHLNNATGDGGKGQEDNYASTVYVIHNFHFNKNTQRIKLKFDWDF